MLYVEDYNEKQRQAARDRIALAHMIAAWHPRRVKRLPKLEAVFEKLDESKTKNAPGPQTDEQMLAAALRWQKRIEEGR